MERYIAFLRGINVSGQKLIKMELLRKILTEAGFNDVKTYIQSGNILFNSESLDSNQLIKKLEELIELSFGFHTEVILRKLSDIELIVNLELLKSLKSDDEKKYYITFLKTEYTESIDIPLFSKNKDVEIIYQNAWDFICISRLFKGNYGFPNSFVEKLTGIPATTRNPNTLESILQL
jgi:uncharacterized protein (DUF1697 family)